MCVSCVADYLSVVAKHQALIDSESLIMLQARIAQVSPRVMQGRPFGEAATLTATYWQASQSGSSIEQNLMSVAGSMAEALDDVALMLTAFKAPGATVLFSA